MYNDAASRQNFVHPHTTNQKYKTKKKKIYYIEFNMCAKFVYPQYIYIYTKFKHKFRDKKIFIVYRQYILFLVNYYKTIY